MNNMVGVEKRGWQLLCGDSDSVHFLLLSSSRGLEVIMKQQIWTGAITELPASCFNIATTIQRWESGHERGALCVNGPMYIGNFRPH